MSEQFIHLFTPIKIGDMMIPNRIAITGHGLMFAENEGVPSEKHVHYHRERAKGGAGLIISEINVVHPTSNDFLNMVRGYDERCIPAWRKVVDAVHEYDTRIFAQVGHVGRQSDTTFSDMALWAPSPIPCPVMRETPHAMSLEEIEEMIDAYARTAGHMKEAGFDGVEIHSSHGGYLIGEFLSPFSNKRTDEYGGSLENRMRFLLRIIDAVRDRVGDGFVVGDRLSGDEFTPAGLTLEDFQEIARRVEATGKVDYIGQSMGNYFSIETVVPDMSFPPGAFVPLSAGFRESVTIPVLAVGRINDPLLAENILADGHADMVGMTRATIADPELPLKAKKGRLEEIRPCVGCLQSCVGRIGKQAPASCIHNPAVGKEKELGIGTLKPASSPKRVMVIGGGPAGLKAAEILAKRGHEVSLFEKASRLGGQVNLAVRVPSREELGGVVRYLVHEVNRLGVEVRLEEEMTPEMITDQNPDAVVVATGAVPSRPEIPGADQTHVMTVWEALTDPDAVGQKVLVADGGESHWECCSTVAYLVSLGREVEVVTPLLFVGMGLPGSSIKNFNRSTLGKGAVFSCHEMITEIDGPTVQIIQVYSLESRTINGVDTVVLASGRKAEDGIFEKLKKEAVIKELYAVGDCYAPRLLDSAIREGEQIGRLI